MYGRKPLSINTSICSLFNCVKSSSLQVMCVTSTVGSYQCRQLKLRWKWCDVGSFINLLVRVLYFSKIPFFQNNKLFGCFLVFSGYGTLAYLAFSNGRCCTYKNWGIFHHISAQVSRAWWYWPQIRVSPVPQLYNL